MLEYMAHLHSCQDLPSAAIQDTFRPEAKADGHIIHLAFELEVCVVSNSEQYPHGILILCTSKDGIDQCPKMKCSLLKRNDSRRHIRKKNSSRVWCHRASAVCRFLPGDKASDVSNGSRQEVGKWKTVTRADQRVWQVTGMSCHLLDRAAGCLFHQDEQHCS